MSFHRKDLTKNLRAALAAATGRPGDVREIKADTQPPYFILYPVPGGGYSGPPLSKPDADVQTVYQVTSVGTSPESAEWLADRIRVAMLGRSTLGSFSTDIDAPNGMSIVDRTPDGGPGGVDAEGSVYSIAERFNLHLTPS